VTLASGSIHSSRFPLSAIVFKLSLMLEESLVDFLQLHYVFSPHSLLFMLTRNVLTKMTFIVKEIVTGANGFYLNCLLRKFKCDLTQTVNYLII
jgi:hypothetical protein